MTDLRTALEELRDRMQSGSKELYWLDLEALLAAHPAPSLLQTGPGLGETFTEWGVSWDGLKYEPLRAIDHDVAERLAKNINGINSNSTPAYVVSREVAPWRVTK